MALRAPGWHDRFRLAACCVASALLACTLLLLPLTNSPQQFVRDPHDLQEASRILEEIEASAEEGLQRRLAEAGEQADLNIGRYGLSPKPWFQEMVDRYGAPPRQNRHQYQRPLKGRKLAGQVLSEENTGPIRVHLNFDTLYEDKVQANQFVKDRYCFREGDWFRTGYPTETKPSGSGPDSCGNRKTTPVTGDKWCICTENDVITESMRSFVIEATTAAMNLLPSYLNVRPLQDNLKFRNWEGSYGAMWQQTGQTGACCDPDCQKGLHVTLAGSLCTDGVENFDAMMSVSMPPPSPGVGGAGTFCSSDQHGRPTHFVFQWHRRVDAKELTKSESNAVLRAAMIQSWRGLVLHEAIHGLGFGSGLWQNSFHSNGTRREIVKQLEVSDHDGTKDVVYHFVQGTRTFEAAKAYFGCDQDDEWLGLPLMSWPVSGRDTHHETRVLRDDVMSYGDGLQAVSAITLASLEDTGHYLANYSNADCMYWGRGRGCDFVKKRCEVRSTGEVVEGISASTNCDRSWTEDFTAANDVALEKCIELDCESRVVGGSAVCDVECYTGTEGDTTCKEAPAGGEVAAAGSSSWADGVKSDYLAYDGTMESLESLAAIGFAPVLFLSACIVGKCVLCPKADTRRAKCAFYFLAALIVLFGAALVAAGGYSIYDWETAQVFFSRQRDLVYGVMALGACVMLFGCFGIYAVAREHSIKMMVFAALMVMEILCLCFLVFLFVKFAGSLDSLEADAMAQAGGVTFEESEEKSLTGQVQEKVIQEFTSLTCRTYQACCEDTELLDLRVESGSPRQCKVPHAGVENDASFVLSDPSHPDFCFSLSGVSSGAALPLFMCAVLEQSSEGGFTVERCREDYCVKGLQGLENFLSVAVSAYRQQMHTIGMGFCFLMAAHVVLLLILWNVHSAAKRKSRVANDRSVVSVVSVVTRMSYVDDDGDGDDDYVDVLPARKTGHGAARQTHRQTQGPGNGPDQGGRGVRAAGSYHPKNVPRVQFGTGVGFSGGGYRG